jgi:serine/threonine protein kinase
LDAYKKYTWTNLFPHCHVRQPFSSDTDVKISDFGNAKKVTFPNSLRTQCGTEGYVAPEILEHRPAYDTPCDMWSVGVIIYTVLGGYRPFRSEDKDEVMKQIRYGEYKFHKRYWSHVSQGAKDLIAGMLTVDPQQRMTAEKALKSPWIQADDSKLRNDLSENKEQLKDLRTATKSKFKGAVNAIIASNAKFRRIIVEEGRVVVVEESVDEQHTVHHT